MWWFLQIWFQWWTNWQCRAGWRLVKNVVKNPGRDKDASSIKVWHDETSKNWSKFFQETFNQQGLVLNETASEDTTTILMKISLKESQTHSGIKEDLKNVIAYQATNVQLKALFTPKIKHPYHKLPISTITLTTSNKAVQDLSSSNPPNLEDLLGKWSVKEYLVESKTIQAWLIPEFCPKIS